MILGNGLLLLILHLAIVKSVTLNVGESAINGALDGSIYTGLKLVPFSLCKKLVVKNTTTYTWNWDW